MKSHIIRFIDSFFFLFKRFMPLSIYRYAACGGLNLTFDTFLYFYTYNFILQKQNVDLDFVVLSAHIASLFLVFPITFVTGFLLSKHIVFQDSKKAVGSQIFKYLIVGLGAISISYMAMKILVDLFNFYPTPSRLISILITIVYNYILQNKFTFKTDIYPNR